ncbi:MAG: hypothetical protein JRF63_15905, partial [Deltaproteobacteria bacterium]|nr:hypothetical protein [Deltaproteobacteria bacterium]
FRRARDWGVWNLEVDNQGDTQTTDFDASAAPRGWNLVGSFELADGEVSVALPDTTTGQLVIADAIRWLPTAGNGTPTAYAMAEGE